MIGVLVGRDSSTQGNNGHWTAGAGFRGMYLEAEELQGFVDKHQETGRDSALQVSEGV